MAKNILSFVDVRFVAYDKKPDYTTITPTRPYPDKKTPPCTEGHSMVKDRGRCQNANVHSGRRACSVPLGLGASRGAAPCA